MCLWCAHAPRVLVVANLLSGVAPTAAHQRLPSLTPKQCSAASPPPHRRLTTASPPPHELQRCLTAAPRVAHSLALHTLGVPQLLPRPCIKVVHVILMSLALALAWIGMLYTGRIKLLKRCGYACCTCRYVAAMLAVHQPYYVPAMPAAPADATRF